MINSQIIISFSSRKNGNCELISEFLGSVLGKSVRKYRFTEFYIHPCGGCDYECFQDSDACPYTGDMEIELLQEISRSDEAYFVVPNYCDHPNAWFYIFNERSNCWFQNHPKRLEQYLKVKKKFLVVSSTQSDSFLRAFQQHTEDTPDILYLSARLFGSGSSIAGDLMHSEEAKAAILKFLEKIPEKG